MRRAGPVELNKALGRKAARRLAGDDPPAEIAIDAEQIPDYLGVPRYEFGLAEEQDESTGDPPWQIQVIVEEEAPQGFERGTKCGRSPDPEADAGRPLLGADEAGQA